MASFNAGNDLVKAIVAEREFLYRQFLNFVDFVVSPFNRKSKEIFKDFVILKSINLLARQKDTSN